MRLHVNEIFKSIQGEGYWTGMPCAFLRLQGCNMDSPCEWCDTPQGQRTNLPCEDIGVHHIQEVLDAINDKKMGVVVVTGGEPLIQSHAIQSLIQLDAGQHRWHLETNGTLPIPGVFDWVTVSPKTADLRKISPQAVNMADELKLVIASTADLRIATKYKRILSDILFGRTRLYLQPVSVCPTMTRLCVEWLLTEPDPAGICGLSVQVHKLIGVP